VNIQLRYPSVGELMTTGHIVVQPYGCEADEGGRLLSEFGTRLMRDLLAHLQARPERRMHERHRFDPPFHFYPALPVLDVDRVSEALGEDLTPVSMRFWTQHPPTATHVVIQLPIASEDEPVAVLARVARTSVARTGGHEVIVQFVGDEHAALDWSN
jgi:hypothetical protein